VTEEPKEFSSKGEERYETQYRGSLSWRIDQKMMRTETYLTVGAMYFLSAWQTIKGTKPLIPYPVAAKRREDLL